MKKTFYLFTLIFLLNGCVESVALLGSTVGGASSSKMIQSSLQSTLSYGIKKQTGKTPLGHALAYAEKNNPDKKKETCISFIEKTRSEFCTIAKNKISLTSNAVKEKIASVIKKNPKIADPVALEIEIKPKNKDIQKNLNYSSSLNQLNKSSREIVFVLETELKKIKKRYIK